SKGPDNLDEDKLGDLLAQYDHALVEGQAGDLLSEDSAPPEFRARLEAMKLLLARLEEDRRQRETSTALEAGSPEPHDSSLPPENMLPGPSLGAASEASRLPCPEGYQLLGEVGRGGMGVVYRARDLRTGRIVALKMIRSAGLASPAHVARFQFEAEATANLD